jgi:hypothetical protein
MRTLTTSEADLLACVLRTGDYEPHGDDARDAIADDLEQRGLLAWTYGPISTRADAIDPTGPDAGMEIDPVVTPAGVTALECARLAGLA